MFHYLKNPKEFEKLVRDNIGLSFCIDLTDAIKSKREIDYMLMPYYPKLTDAAIDDTKLIFYFDDSEPKILNYQDIVIDIDYDISGQHCGRYSVVMKNGSYSFINFLPEN